MLLGWFMENNIQHVSHPPCSPDLNPNKNVWRWMAKDIYKHGSQFETINDLHAAVYASWASIPNILMQKLMNMPKEIFNVIRKSGGYTEYQIVIVNYLFCIFFQCLSKLIN